MSIHRLITGAVSTVLMSCALSAQALPQELENPEINSIGRMPARAYSMPLANERAAFTYAEEPTTPYVKLLNGNWKISWCGDPSRRPLDFWKTDYDDSSWETIDVPSCVEMRGFGSPGYTNINYPHLKRQPLIRDVITGEDDYNPVSSYRTVFTVPAEWAGRDVILRFDGVYSAYFVWVNGQKVGYSEDSKLPAEFDITPYVNNGENTLAVEVYRWCDGSYLEDQDMFRFSGIYRDVSIIGMPKKRIQDFFVHSVLSSNLKDANVEVEVSSTAGAVSGTLYDAAFRKVGSFSGSKGRMKIWNAHLWSAEDPYLYTLVLRSGKDIRATRVGLKQVEIKDGVLLVNGQAIKIKGVNRHEHSARNGRSVSKLDMLDDILLMKRYNINAVRTSHYPDHHTWYDLCDRYGIYLIAEANVEGHQYGYGEDGLGLKPEWDKAIVERNSNHVLNYRNHPSIVFWSLGNETGHGDCFRHARAAVNAIDPTRPVHWERGNEDADIFSRMYYGPDWLQKRGADHSKPFFMCEYAHAMGNAVGNLKEYWDAFYSSDSLCGGCIWDWVDQALEKQTTRFDILGKPQTILAYGGDYDEVPNDGPFCCNGLIQPDRKPTAKLAEVKHVYRQISVSAIDADSRGLNPADGSVEVWNRFSFTPTDAFEAGWTLLEDGKAVARGRWNVAPVEPGRKSIAGMPQTGYTMKNGCEYFLIFSWTLKDAALWAPKGHEIASDQIAVKVPDGAPAKAVEILPACKPVLSEDSGTITVSTGAMKAVFNKKAGALESLSVDGRPVLDAKKGTAAAPRLSCMRAFVDNDCWLRDGWKQEATGRRDEFKTYGLTQLHYHNKGISHSVSEDGCITVKTVTDVTGSKSAGFSNVIDWVFRTDGTLTMEIEAEPYGHMPWALPRLGMSMLLDSSLENVCWYGRGPQENYTDRCSGSHIAQYASTVTELYESYVRPQDNGYRGDVRWVEFTDAQGHGVRFSADVPLFVQALHYDWEDLDGARHRNGQERMDAMKYPREEICLNLDIRQLGLGGASCGNRPLDEYIFPIRKENWSITVSAR